MENVSSGSEVSGPKGIERWLRKAPQIPRKPFLVALLLIALGLLALLVYLNRSSIAFTPKPEYTTAYSLVAPSISESANIVVHLPKGVDAEQAKNNITFHPGIKGEWVLASTVDSVVYNPEKKLSVGKYYTVTLTSPEGTIGKDFLAEEDPAVAAVFPKADTETHEKTNITVVFNRPMIPVSTVDKTAEKEIPLVIEPATPGRFKWVGTRTVQFIPETTLKASTNYRISIPDSLPSLEGIRIASVAPVTFTTRHLRYDALSHGSLRYNQPVRIQFNQPVDLEKTAREITLVKIKGEDRENVEAEIEYGTKAVFNTEKNVYETVQDTSAVNVFQKKDTHGRKKLWDFTENYTVTIKKAYPVDGDIILAEERSTSVIITGVIESLTANSPRTGFAAPNFFDPEGQLVLRFFEDINIDKSAIDAPHITSLTYGEKCPDTGEQGEKGESFFYSDVPCEKVPDKRTVLLTVDKSKFTLGDTFQLVLKRIVNMEGLTINPDVIRNDIKLPPVLKVRQPTNGVVVPAYGNITTLESLVFCSNSPIEKNYGKTAPGVTATPGFEKAPTWNKSMLIPEPIPENISVGYYVCNPGEFQTELSYGLAPETAYTLSVPTEDPFGSKELVTVPLKTGKMPGVNLTFFHLQKNYTVTTPLKTKLTYATQNMEFIDVHVCKVSSETLLKYVTVGGPQFYEGPGTVGPCISTVTKRIPIDRHFWVNNYVQVDLKEFSSDILGSYVVTLSHPDYREPYAQQRPVFERTFVSVTNLSVVEKKIELHENQYAPEGLQEGVDNAKRQALSNIYWVTDSKTLAPVLGARISVFTSQNKPGANFVESGTIVNTGKDGLATALPRTDQIGVVVSIPGDSTILPSNSVQLQYGTYAQQSESYYVYTDRPIYRPTHEVFIKGLYRGGYDGAYEILQGKKITIKVYDSSSKELLSEEVSVSDFGTFETRLVLPKDAPLGSYRIQAGNNGYGSFEVEEYVPAAFKVDAKATQEEYVTGDAVSVDIDAAYYFGAPVEGGTIEYSLGSQNYYFDKYRDEYFTFGSGWYSCYRECNYGDKFILRNRVSLGANGKARITHTLDFKKIFPNEDDRQSKIVVMYITVKNTSGQSITKQVSFIVHGGDYYLGLATDKFFGSKNDPVGMKVKSVDIKGKPLRVRDITLAWNKVSYTYAKRQEVDGGFYYNWEQKFTSVYNETFSTNGDGNWSGTYTPTEQGEYELKLSGVDSRGNTIQTKTRLYITGSEQAGEGLVQPTNDTSLEIVTDKASLGVGDTANIIIKSPFQQAKALVAVERGQVFHYEVVDVKYGLHKYSFPIKEAYVPNVYASVTLLSDSPEVKSGNIAFQINTRKKEIDIVAKPNKKEYLPGEEVTITFTAKDSDGKPVETELSAAVVDMSVLALKGNPKKNPVMFFYGGFPLTVSTASNLKNILQQIEVPNGTKGGGGSEPEDLATKKRGEFKDTAFWQGTLKTDKNGRATAIFRLPDNLTTWQLESVGITKDTKLGVSYSEFTAKKNLMVVPLYPRFAIPGDEFMVGAKVFNQTATRQTFAVTYESENLPLVKSGDSKKNITLAANETRTVYFRVATDAHENNEEGYRLQFTVGAKNSRYEDTVEQSILLSKNATYETLATAGVSSADALRESVYVPGNIIPDRGELTIKSSATLAVFLSDAIKFLVQYPYSSTEEIATKLEAIAVYKEGMALKNVGDAFGTPTGTFDGITYSMDEIVQLGLAKLYKYQTTDGGFTYYQPQYGYGTYGMQGDVYLTTRIARALDRLEKVGYTIDKEKQRSVFRFLAADFQYHVQRNPIWYERHIAVASALYDLKKYGTVPASVPNQIRLILRDEKYLKERIGTQTLATLNLLLSAEKKEFGSRAINQTLDLLENRIEIDARGAYVKPNAELMWECYETPIRDTALLVKAMIRADRLSEVTPNIIRWLLASRDKNGAWSSTMNTISTADALVEYLGYSRETESDFTLSTSLPNEKSDTTIFNKDTLFQTRILKVPNAQIQKDTLMSIEFKKENHNRRENTLYYDIAFRYFLPLGVVAPRDEGFTLSRTMYVASDTEEAKPVLGGRVGDVLKVKGELIVPKSRNHIAIEEYIPAGAEIVNFNLATESREALENNENNTNNDPYYGNNYWYGNNDGKRPLYPSVQETRDDRLYMVVDRLDPGVYTYEYFIRLLVPGTFQHLPAVVNEKYFPENFGRTGGSIFTIKE